MVDGRLCNARRRMLCPQRWMLQENFFPTSYSSLLFFELRYHLMMSHEYVNQNMTTVQSDIFAICVSVSLGYFTLHMHSICYEKYRFFFSRMCANLFSVM